MNKKTVKAGDLVRVRPDLNKRTPYMGQMIWDSMLKFGWEEAKVVKVLSSGDVFKLNCDNGTHLWNIEMVTEPEPPQAPVKKVKVIHVTHAEVEEKFGWPVVILD